MQIALQNVGGPHSTEVLNRAKEGLHQERGNSVRRQPQDLNCNTIPSLSFQSAGSPFKFRAYQTFIYIHIYPLGSISLENYDKCNKSWKIYNTYFILLNIRMGSHFREVALANSGHHIFSFCRQIFIQVSPYIDFQKGLPDSQFPLRPLYLFNILSHAFYIFPLSPYYFIKSNLKSSALLVLKVLLGKSLK